MFVLILFISLADISSATDCQNFNRPAVYQLTPPIDHGECPMWDTRKNVLYYVDIHNGNIYSYQYNTKEIHSIHLNGEVAPVILSKSNPNLLIVGVNTSVVAVQWNGNGSDIESEKVLVQLPDEKQTNRLNDGKADNKGQLWFGTMGFESTDGSLEFNQGSLHKISKELLTERVITPVNISNGLVWNKANNKFYYIDSPTQKIVEYDYDSDKGVISNPETIFDFHDNMIMAFPDGMTIDKDDNLWIALYKGGSIIQIDPKTKKLLQRVPIPALCVTSLIWGGPDLDILFVTTSRYTLSENERDQQPAAGSVFAVTNLNTNGFASYEADLNF